jgi:hypothetical protein
MDTLFDQPMARNTDPETSHEAAEDAKSHSSKGHLLAMRFLLLRPMTDYELASATGWQQNSIGKRRGELMNAGLVVVHRDEEGNVVKRLTPSGSRARVWDATVKGREWYGEQMNLRANA